MKKPFVIFVAALLISIIITSCTSTSMTIDEANVVRAYMHLTIKDESQTKEFIGSELSDLVKWFNAATDIRLNPTFKGAATIVGMKIELKDQRQISILDSGDQFEIQITDLEKGKTVSYWAKEPHIEAILATIDNEQ